LLDLEEVGHGVIEVGKECLHVCFRAMDSELVMGGGRLLCGVGDLRTMNCDRNYRMSGKCLKSRWNCVIKW
jgi:hypothetical protein